MFIIPRYIIRQHFGPFFFSLFTIIFIFLTNYIIQNLYKVIGKGLHINVILELISLNMAWIFALAAPMSVLVAVMMVFGRLAQDNEYTALKACGYSLYRIIFYLLITSVIFTYINILFTDKVLPEANHKLKLLTSDIRRKKPTISFEEGVFSDPADGIPGYRIMFREIDENSQNVEGVVIFDYTESDVEKVIIAEKGTLKFDYYRDCMILNLTDGEIHETNKYTFEEYKRLEFEKFRKIINIDNLSLSRRSYGMRSDREMNIKMMWNHIDRIKNNIDQEKIRIKEKLENHFKKGYDVAAYLKELYNNDDVNRKVTNSLTNDLVLKNARSKALLEVKNTLNNLRYRSQLLENLRLEIEEYKVEIHKKYSIPASCIIFVLIGVPLGLMARSGKIGVSGGISLVFFIIYWSFLIGGEELADRGYISPFTAMWSPNLLVGLFGIILTFKTARELTIINFSKLKLLLPKRFR